MFKKTLSVLLACLMLLCSAAAASAAPAAKKHQLKFDTDGKFKIIHLTDIQDDYPLVPASKQFIKEMLAAYTPDLVVLGGDNTVSSYDDKEASIKEICDIFVESGTYFTLVFGNHDAEQGYTREELFPMYERFGGEYFLGYDAANIDGSDMTGVGTHNLTVMSSDGTKVAYNLYMFDSNMYVKDENGTTLGYDCVHEDQIEWYKATSAKLKEENGGVAVPAMAFQHIVVQEAVEQLFYKSAVSLGAAGRDYDGVHYTFLPKPSAIKDGLLFEMPCPGYYNLGQFDAMVETGDVKAVFSGHDHVNDYTITLDGINITNTAGETFHSYSKIFNRGARLIVLDEKDLSSYETTKITCAEMTLRDGSLISETEGGMSKAQATFAVALNKILNMLTKICGMFTILSDKVC